ncbi:helix-turn-helix domain-containing protein [Streptomyces sp. SP17BM10]|uniref:helix-turn-helix domain-containing protein n=1 Tax=Streptomyces sp. SP17BM10 TaxID=3002530 RepID=UPI002E7600B8|nr:helix-turn-helix domain-containing protein [Streptomyces sp. SP17BM10]MEE1787747.1 helix-turn-helix domain-containing protein [Streptomyces sp. SP17BM10]
MPKQTPPRRPASVAEPRIRPLPDTYLEPEDIARIFQVPLETVYQWRRKRTGPPGFRVGRHLRYHPDAVAQWAQNQEEAA